MLRAILHCGNRQHLGPDPEQEFAYLLAHRHVIEHGAHLDGVLNGHGFLLLQLLGQADRPRHVALLGKETGEELVEFFIDQLEHAASGFRVLFDDLHDALDFRFKNIALDGHIKTQRARSHAVDQLARRMLQQAEKLRLGDRDPEDRHLQACKPDTNLGRNAVLGQYALKHQGDDFNRGFFRGIGSRLFQHAGPLAQFLKRPVNLRAGKAQVRLPGLPGAVQDRFFSLLLKAVHGVFQLWRGLARAGLVKPLDAAHEQLLEMPKHALRPHPHAGQRRGRGLRARLFLDGIARPAASRRCR